MSIVGKVSATKGALLKAKEQYSFILKGKEILEMKRDRLAGDINKSLPIIRKRDELENKLLNLYHEAKKVISSVGVNEAASYSKAVRPIRTKLLIKSIMGVPEPHIKLLEEVKVSAALNPYIQNIASTLLDLFNELLEVAEVEAKVEREALELMSVNRKVNALEKILIPAYVELIRYIEERISEEELEEFVKTKYIITRVKGE